MVLRGFGVAASALSSFTSLATALYVNGSVVAPCDSPIYCHGELLRAIELAQPFSDSKTFVDLPTLKAPQEVLDAFAELPRPITNNSDLQDFLTTYFGQAGSELEPVPDDELTTDPQFILHVNNTDLVDFVLQVIAIWPDLTRKYVGAVPNCTVCADSFIPLERSFVVAGGRFREAYYWDSFWVIEGLLRTRGAFTEIARNIIENFLDFVETFGFVPNGSRIYYLNRSQPPLLAQMVSTYLNYTGDASILERAIPLLEREHAFWMNNRTVEVSFGNETYVLNHYAVNNTQPRPESYREDWVTANNESYYSESGIVYPEKDDLTMDERAELYANLASGAESGWDYSSRWLANPADAVEDKYFPLRSLNVIETVPVCLNSILYANEVAIANFIAMRANDSAAEMLRAGFWMAQAKRRQEAMQALMWNDTFSSFFDYNLTSGSQNVFVLADEDATEAETTEAGAPEGYMLSLSPAQFYPFWLGAADDSLTSNPLAVRQAYKRVAAKLAEKDGAIAATNLFTGQQWDEPNVWPPLMYILIAGLIRTPPTFGENDEDFIWIQDLALRLAQRYVDSAFCTWRATGGATGDLPRIQGVEEEDANGVMFEKYADNATNVAGGGGEYEVVEGFGWTNGVLIWIADLFGRELTLPECGDLGEQVDGGQARMRHRQRSAVELDRTDAKWVKKFW
ncbi:Six-hairpin glycosidase-like protein [Lineolata rhizophorae]|uniref:Trehalase n=1 Tax=Lineolata rhizophorae TaxID=578093 RepID=A0A6A6NQD5_9PEZI|nr:Six-hairpin glycosidase-like protein [Lineolata rhizophorae]